MPSFSLRTLLTLATASLAVTAAPAPAAPAPIQETRDYVNYNPQVTTSYGDVDITYQGFLNTTTNVEEFLAIPYAKPPLGQLRFNRPQPWVPGTETLLNSTIAGPACRQPGMNSTSSEDCLHLNIIRHTNVQYGEKLPVLVWIYGGDYISGYIDSPEYNPTQIVLDSISIDHPTIVVSMNYRVGSYGFLLGEQAIAANATNNGILDQRLALEWIQEHIESFGGDPEKVTIFGASAGGGSVVGQLVLEGMDKKGLFAGAMHMSGAFIWNWQRSGLLEFQEDLYSYTGCVGELDPVGCMRLVPETDLFNAISMIGSNEWGDNFGPIWGDDIFPESLVSLIKKGYLADVPIITGDVADELAGFVPYLTNTSVEAATFLADCLLSLTGQDASVFWPLYVNLTVDLSPHTDVSTQFTYAPYYRQLATVITDLLFITNREMLLETALARGSPVWGYSYQQTWPSDPLDPVPVQYGSTHYSDIPMWFGSAISNDTSIAQLGINMRKAMISFANTQDPAAISGVKWDAYSVDQSIIVWNAANTTMVPNDAHKDQLDAILKWVV